MGMSMRGVGIIIRLLFMRRWFVVTRCKLARDAASRRRLRAASIVNESPDVKAEVQSEVSSSNECLSALCVVCKVRRRVRGCSINEILLGQGYSEELGVNAVERETSAVLTPPGDEDVQIESCGQGEEALVQ